MESKLIAPASRRDDVVRLGALRMLESVLERRVAVVCAPAGYGKSTLLAQFRGQLSERGIPEAWLTLGKSDGKPRQLLAYLVLALAQIAPQLRKLTDSARVHFSGMSEQTAAIAVANAVARIDRTCVLFLDDFDAPDRAVADIDALFRPLVSTPSRLKIVIACRSQPSLELRSLAAAGDLVDIRAEQLRFDGSEAQEMFRLSRASAPATSEVETIVAKTEGWPIALRMAGQLGASAKLLDPGQGLSGRSTVLVDYLLEQCFQRIPDKYQQVLLRTSIVHRFNGSLVNALCERADGWEIIEQLDRGGLFVIPLDHERDWYRYHFLFREFLSERVRLGAGLDTKELHARAARWFEERGEYQTAFEHYVEWGDVERAADMIEAAGGWYSHLGWGDLSWPRRVFHCLRSDLVETRPRLYLARALLAAKSGIVTDLRAAIEHAKQLRAGRGERDSAPDWECTALEFALGIYLDEAYEPEHIEELIAQAYADANDQVWLIATLYNGLCMSHLDRAAFAESAIAADTTLSYVKSGPYGHWRCWCDIHIALGYTAQGRTSDAMVLLEGIGSEIGAVFGPDTDVGAVVCTIMADLLWEQNRTEDARRLLDAGFAHVVKGEGWCNIYMMGFRTSAALAHAEFGLEAALEVIDSAEAFARRRSLSRLLRFALVLRAHELAMAGKSSEALHVLDSLGEQHESMTEGETRRLYWQLREGEQAIRARVMIDSGDAPAALKILVRLRNQMQKLRCARQVLGVTILMAMAHLADDNRDRARSEMAHALKVAEAMNARRAFVAEGNKLLELLADTLQYVSDLSDNVRKFGMSLLDSSEYPRRQRSETQAGGAVEISAREREILALIGAGLSNKEIAATLSLSESTIKFHRRNLYGKLDARSRSRALAAGRRLGLIG